MMTEDQHLLVKAAEECGEVAERCLKAANFGILEVQDGQPLNNRERIELEFLDLIGVMQRMAHNGLVTDPFVLMTTPAGQSLVSQKIKKLERWMTYARQQGTLGT